MADHVVPSVDERSGAGVEARVASADIARRRAARDLWISKGHVAAAVAVALGMSALAFAGGMSLGKRWASPVAAAPASLTAEVPRDELLRLLARIDGNASGPTSALTFPDALRGQGPADPRGPGPLAGPTTLVAGGAPAVTGDALPGGGKQGVGWTVVLSTTASEEDARTTQRQLLSAGVAAVVGVELVEGTARYRVLVGQHEDRAAAVEAAKLLASAGTPVVEALLPTPPPPAPGPAPGPAAPVDGAEAPVVAPTEAPVPAPEAPDEAPAPR